ncbi:hypothetical protein KQI22_00530 [Kineothrix sp. MSJ-39]|uniref:hypothetical protein n=1 Tax=Kineothrix sp. MSJ-39 TaxID=2841533 RepID=UPI001C1067F2|nr:hypothetical protein [Kineothrix sp. MSJ-39]MBU5428548.1 hypothetical protein [Kineothrix sp. MSJ-39]
MRLNKITAFICCMSLFLTGCGHTTAQPELVTPVSAQKEYGVVRRGSLGEKKFYDAYVTPELVCVASQVDGLMQNNFKQIGDTVKEGDVLLEMETEDLDQQIQLYTNKLTALDEIYTLNNQLSQKDIHVNQVGQSASSTKIEQIQNDINALQNSIGQNKEELKTSQKQLKRSISQNSTDATAYKKAIKDEEKILSQKKEELQQYKEQKAYTQEDLNDYIHQKESGVINQNMDTQLYLTERKSCQETLAQLKEKKENFQLKAPCDGVIVSTYYFNTEYHASNPRYLPANTPLVIVGKSDTKYLQIPDLTESDLKGAYYAYAKIGDKEYPLTQVKQDSTLKSWNVKKQAGAGSDLIDLPVRFACPPALANSLSTGDFISIYIQEKVSKDVCAAPNDTLYRENGKYYVIKCTDGKEEKIYVETGLKTSYETEIRSGVSEGDVLLSKKVFFETEDSHEVQLTKSDFVWKDRIRGMYLSNPYSQLASPDVEKARVAEICVKEMQDVKKGDVLVKLTLYSHKSQLTKLTYKLKTLTQDEEKEIAQINKQQNQTNGNMLSLSPDDAERSVLKSQTDYFETLKALTHSKYKYERLNVETELANLKKEEENAVIRAASDGYVYNIDKTKIGKIVTPVDSIVEVVPYGRTTLCINDEANAIPFGAKAEFTTVVNGKEATVSGTVIKAMNVTPPWLLNPDGFITFIMPDQELDEAAYRSISNIVATAKVYKNCYQITAKMKYEDEYGNYVYILENGKRTKKYVTLAKAHEGVSVVLDGISEDCVVLERERE